mgnify:CR=1 FL=1
MNKIQELELMLNDMDNGLEKANKEGIPFEYKKTYYPKIEYYAEQLAQAVKNRNLREIDRAHNRMNHFINQQWKEEFGQ